MRFFYGMMQWEIAMAKDFNHPKVVESYDEHIRKLIPAYELIHLQVNALLKSYMPDQAHILIVGCGTGHELDYLVQQFPHWRFTAIDPALNMLEKAQAKLQLTQPQAQITFLNTDTTALKHEHQHFDAALSILVSHFIPHEMKVQFFQDIYAVLKEKGLYLSYDLTQIEEEKQLNSLQYLAELTGLAPKQSQAMIDRLADDFALSSNDKMHHVLKKIGFNSVQNFAQVLNYFGVIAVK